MCNFKDRVLVLKTNLRQQRRLGQRWANSHCWLGSFEKCPCFYFRKMLAIGGSAVDSAIAALICLGVMSPESSGIGGGSFMVVYDRSVGTGQ